MAALTSQGHDYLITVKGNQPKLHQSLIHCSQTQAAHAAWSWQQRGHGHDVRCRLKCWPADRAMQTRWAGLRTYISVRRQGVRDAKPFDHTTYYISSASLSAWQFAQRIRGHRKIENTLHWSKDVVLKEDDCGLLDSQAAANMGLLRNMSFNLLVMAGYRSLSEGIGAMGECIERLWSTMNLTKPKRLKL